MRQVAYMHHSTQRHNASFFGVLFACSISLALTATPAIAETDDMTGQPVASSTDEPVMTTTASEEEPSSESDITSTPNNDPEGSSDGAETTSLDTPESAPDDEALADTTSDTHESDTQANPDSTTQASDSVTPELSSDSPQQEDSPSEEPTSVSETPEQGEVSGDLSTVIPLEGVATEEVSRTTSETPKVTSAASQPKTPVAAGNLKVEGSYYLTLPGTSRVVEVRRASKDNGAEIWLYKNNGKQHQKIYLERDAEGYYTAWLVGTGKVLDVRGGSTKPGTKVIQWASTGRDNQKWAILANDDGSYRLVNKATGLVLGKAKSGYGLVGMKDNGAQTNTFLLKAVNLLSTGIYRITPRTNSATSLDVKNASTANGANLILCNNSGALNQRFELISAGKENLWYIRTGSSGGWVTYKNGKLMQYGSKSVKPIGMTWRTTFQGGWYSLINVRSGKALDMRHGLTTSGTEIIAYKPNGKDSQHFTFVKSNLITPGTYTLDSSFGTRLEVRGNSKAMGANVQTWRKKPASSNLNQRFRIERKGSGYILVNARSGLVVGVSEIYSGGSSSKATHNATQRYSSGKNNQIWKASIDDGGFVKFTNVASGMVLATTTRYAGANVRQVAAIAGEERQRWKLTKASSESAAKTQVAKTNILFFGNSFTYYEDLPRLVGQSLSKTEVVSCTRGSALLSQHLSTTDALGRQSQRAIAKGNWDYVVVQEMSTEAIDDYDTYLKSLTEMVALIKAVGATPIIYQTWAFEGGTGSQGYGSAKREITNAEMHSQLKAAFNQASKAVGVTQAKVGNEIARVRNKGDKKYDHEAFDLRIYSDDKKHLSKFGATIVAKVFVTLFKSLL